MVIVPLMLSVLLVKPVGKNITCPLANRLPVAPANKPVPPSTLSINETGAMPLTGGRITVPLVVPKRVLPLAKLYVKSPLKIAPVDRLTHSLS